MRLPEQVARFNRYVTNPIQRLWAGRLPGFAIIEHVGRKSGASYRTPINLWRSPTGGFAVLLTYGRERDWVKNLLAAGGGQVVWRGRRVTVREPTIFSGPEGWALLPRPVGALARRLEMVDVLHLTGEA
jgi:deazaflavin-dependent oxidoreductase (nitroreductase family)